jgi:hypothetical protein
MQDFWIACGHRKRKEQDREAFSVLDAAVHAGEKFTARSSASYAPLASGHDLTELYRNAPAVANDMRRMRCAKPPDTSSRVTAHWAPQTPISFPPEWTRSARDKSSMEYKAGLDLIDDPGFRRITFFDFIRGPCLFISPLHPAQSFLLLLFFPRPSFLPFLECLHLFSLVAGLRQSWQRIRYGSDRPISQRLHYSYAKRSCFSSLGRHFRANFDVSRIPETRKFPAVIFSRLNDLNGAQRLNRLNVLNSLFPVA